MSNNVYKFNILISWLFPFGEIQKVEAKQILGVLNEQRLLGT